MKEFKTFFQGLNKVYVCNFALIASTIFVIMLNFAVQFSVENLQNHIEDMQKEISSYKGQIGMLEVEWAYLTRPARIRSLSEKYLDDNGYTLASQIKADSEMDKFYAANYVVAEDAQMMASF